MARPGSCVALWPLLVLLCACGQSLAAEPEIGNEERRLKVALIYNFSQFIEWPASALGPPEAPFLICVAGADPFGTTLLAVQKRSHQGHPIVVSHPETVDEARKCHILYLDHSRALFGRELGKALGEAPVLTVSSAGAALDDGVAIGFVQQNDRIRWSMNLNAVRRAQLKVSAKLIEIAVTVIGERGR